MAIELVCPKCSQRLRVGESDAGKHARCPQCRHVFPVGARGESDSASAEQWIMRGGDQATFGPVSKAELDLWVSEGRLTAETEIRREDDPHWHKATALYPSLDPSYSASSYSGTTQNAFADNVPGSANPYFSPATIPQNRTYGRARPHRGATILVLGIIALMVNICGCMIPGICSWYMGSEDLSAMRAGRMDPSGYGMTAAGMVLGIVGTILHGMIFLGMVMGG